MMRFTTAVFSVLLLALPAAWSAPALPKPDADDGAISLPSGFRAVVVADNLGKLRFIAVAPSGDVYVKVREGGITALRDKDGDGRADVKQTFGAGGGSGIAVRDGWLYHSSNSAVFRYRLTPGELVPKGPQETVVSGLPEGKEHWTQELRLRRRGPAARGGRLALERARGPRPPEGRERPGRHGVPEDTRRLLAVRPRQGQPDAEGRLPLQHRAPPHHVRHLEPEVPGLPHGHERARPPAHGRPPALHGGRQRGDARGGDAPAEGRRELRLALHVLGPAQEGAHGGAGVRRRQGEAGGAGQVPRPPRSLPRPLGAHADGLLRWDAVPREVPRRRLRRLPRLVEPRAPAPEGLQRGLRPPRRQGHARRRATRSSRTASPAAPSSRQPDDARFRPARRSRRGPTARST